MAKNKEKQTPATPEDDIAASLLLKEADDSLRQEKLDALWQEWGSTIIGVACMISLGTIIGVGWQKWRTISQASQTASLIEYQATTDSSTIELKGSYKGIANMLAASELAIEEDANPTEITKLLEEAADSNMPREWDILAEWGSLRTRADAATDIPVKLGVADDMATLADRRGNPYTPAILLEAALLKGENGEYADAVRLLEKAENDPLTEGIPTLQTRIQNFLQLYKTETAQ